MYILSMHVCTRDPNIITDCEGIKGVLLLCKIMSVNKAVTLSDTALIVWIVLFAKESYGLRKKAVPTCCRVISVFSRESRLLWGRVGSLMVLRDFLRHRWS